MDPPPGGPFSDLLGPGSRQIPKSGPKTEENRTNVGDSGLARRSGGQRSRKWGAACRQSVGPAMLFVTFPVFHKVSILGDFGIDLGVVWEGFGSLGHNFGPLWAQCGVIWALKRRSRKRVEKRSSDESPGNPAIGVRWP